MSLRHQRGYVFIFFVVAVCAATVSSLYLAGALLKNGVAGNYRQQLMTKTSDKLDQCFKDVIPYQNWYYDNTAMGSSVEANVVNQCGLEMASGMRVVMSNVVLNSVAPYRLIAAWLPPIDGSVDGVSFDYTTGLLTNPKNQDAIQVNGFIYETPRIEAANKQAASMAVNMRNRFMILDDQSGDSNVNWFRPFSCTTPTSSELSCSELSVNAWTALSTISPSVAGVLGLDTTLTNWSQNPWGLDISFCNHVSCGASSSPPYSMIFKTVTPWATEYSYFSSQSL